MIEGPDPRIDGIVAGRFRLVERIGTGGSSIVYRGFDEEDRSTVAVKVFRDELLRSEAPEALSAAARFRREALLLERLRASRFVPELVLARTEGEVWFIAMELVAGRTLGEVLAGFPAGLLPPGFVMLAAELTTGLAEIHARRVLHRDLSPRNVIVVEVGGRAEVRFLDFGIGKPLEAEVDPVTRQATIAGTPQYLSPEQTRGLDIDESSDVYALGAMLYEMASGRVPIAIRSFAELARVRRETPQPLRDHEGAAWLPEDLAATIMACLAKDPGARPPLAELVTRFGEYAHRAEWRVAEFQSLLPESPPPKPAEPALGGGTKLGAYSLAARLGEAPGRETWLAEVPGAREPRVLVVFAPGRARGLGRLEAGLAAAALPAVAGLRPTLDARAIDGRVVWSSPWIEGMTLADEIARRGPLVAPRLAQIGGEILETLIRLREAGGGAHGYLHPGHVILDDFDGVTLLNAGRRYPHAERSPFGTDNEEFPYLSPLQSVTGRTAEECDVFAFGAIVHFAFSGRPPFSGPREAQSRAKRGGPPAPPARPEGEAAPPALARLLARCLAPDPALRPAPLGDLARRFAEALAPDPRPR
ncbi:MAG: protein kinase [Planctomycetota bacterium]